MGFDINAEIKTTLTYKDVALIASMAYIYQQKANKSKDSEVYKHSVDLVNRLGAEIANVH